MSLKPFKKHSPNASCAGGEAIISSRPHDSGAAFRAATSDPCRESSYSSVNTFTRTHGIAPTCGPQGKVSSLNESRPGFRSVSAGAPLIPACMDRSIRR